MWYGLTRLTLWINTVMRLRKLFLTLSTIGMSVFLLFNFCLIWLHGPIEVYEPNVFILVCETALLLVILGFGLYSLLENVQDAKKEIKK